MAGRPPTCIYDPDIHPILAEQYAREGCINKEIADRLGISRSTFYLWRREHEEFAEALRRGKKPVDALVEKSLLKLCFEGNFNAIRYWLNNRRQDRWRDKIEVEHSGQVVLHFDKEDENL